MIKLKCWTTIIVKNVFVYSCKYDKYIYLENVTNWTGIWTTLADSSLNVHYSLSLFDIHIFTTCEWVIPTIISRVQEIVLRCLSDYSADKWDIMQQKVKKIEHFEFSKKRAKIEFFRQPRFFRGNNLPP